MTRTPRTWLTASLLGAVAALSIAPAVAQAPDGGLATYRNDRHGFSLSYPAAQFVALPSATEDGRQFF